jgi:NSS family neurotransmitter:Na+ symporter
MFYYSVVAGWCLRYLMMAVTNQLFTISDYTKDWNAFSESGWQPVLFHVITITIGALIIRKGVVHGIERANRFLIPSLLVLIVISAIRAVTLPGAVEGLKFLFTPDFQSLMDYRIWLQALTQNAWDTGAGWGLILTYAVYMREQEDVPLNAALIGFGNNSVSLLAGITIFCTVFALIPDQANEVLQTRGPANTGLTFVWIPQLFNKMPGGELFATFFFLALTFAALSSLISMLELATRVFMDMKLSRKRALTIVYLAALILGIPSAISVEFFVNQDWTWGIGLMVSGAFIAVAVAKFGAERFRTEQVNSSGNDLKVGRWYNLLIQYAIPTQVLILISWWFWQAIQADPAGWWNPFTTESVGTCIAQWAVVILIFLALNKAIVKRTLRG